MTANRQTVILASAITAAAALGVILFFPSGEDRSVHTFDTRNRPILGQQGQGAEIILFSDYKCPNCRQFEQVHLPVIQKTLIQTGKAHLVFLQSPFLAPDSTTASVAGWCAFQQGNAAFLKFNATLYARQGREQDIWATPEFLRQIARQDGLDPQRFDRCLASPDARAAVQQDLQQHEQAGLRGTPTVFVNGRRTPAGVREIRAALQLGTP